MDKHVRVSWVIISVGWIAAFALWGAAWIASSAHLSTLSILVGVVTATATVREYFIEHDSRMRNIAAVLHHNDRPPGVTSLR